MMSSSIPPSRNRPSTSGSTSGSGSSSVGVGGRLKGGVDAFGGPVVVAVAVVLLLIGGWLLFGDTGGRSAATGSSAGTTDGVSDDGVSGPSSASAGVHGGASGAGEHVEDDAADPADPPSARATLPPGTWDGSEGAPTATSGSSAPGQSGQVVPTAVSVASPTVPTGPGVDGPEGWRPVVEGFGKDWANPYGGKSAWLARVARWCGPQLAAGFTDTDINAVPTDTLTAVQELVGGGEVADVRLTYASGTKVLVRAVIGAQGWKVVTVELDQG